MAEETTFSSSIIINSFSSSDITLSMNNLSLSSAGSTTSSSVVLDDDDDDVQVYEVHHYPVNFVIPMTLFMAVVMGFAFVGNSMTLLTIWRHRGMRTRTNMFVANLAVADILVAVFDIPLAMVTLVKGTWVFGPLACSFNGFTVGVGLMLSIHTLMWISVHKSVSITKPFSRSMTKKRVLLMIALAWGWTVLYNLSPWIFNWTKIVFKKGSTQCGPTKPVLPLQLLHSLTNTVFNILVPFLVMTVCYIKIFVAVRTHIKTMQERTNLDFKKSFEQQKRVAVTLFIVLTCFLVCWLPYLIYSCTLAFSKKKIPDIYNPIAYWCGYFNSACNPIIYAWRSSSFRKGYLEIICGQKVQGPIGGESWTEGSSPLKKFSVFVANNMMPHKRGSTAFSDYPSPSMFERSMSYLSRKGSSTDSSSTGSSSVKYTKKKQAQLKKVSMIAEASEEEDPMGMNLTDNPDRDNISSSDDDDEEDEALSSSADQHGIEVRIVIHGPEGLCKDAKSEQQLQELAQRALKVVCHSASSSSLHKRRKRSLSGPGEDAEDPVGPFHLQRSQSERNKTSSSRANNRSASRNNKMLHTNKNLLMKDSGSGDGESKESTSSSFPILLTRSQPHCHLEDED